MQFIILLLSFYAGLVSQAANQAEPTESSITYTPSIEEVTVYLQGAQITHRATVAIPEGRQTIVFTGLNSEVDSRRATVGFDGEGDENLEVVSVNHRTQQIQNPQNRDQIDQLLSERSDIENHINELQIDLDVNSYELNMLRENLNPEQSDAQALRQLLELHRERIRSIELNNGILSDSLQTLRSRLNEINQTLRQPDFQPEITVGELLIVVQANQPVSAASHISYPIDAAGWTPEYDLYVDAAGDPVRGKLSASLYNNSRQPWNSVDLILSTQIPQTGIDIPEISPWFLDYVKRVYMQSEASPANLRSNKISGTVMDVQSEAPIATRVEQMASREFMIRDQQTIPSKSDGQRILIEENSVESDFSYLSIPKINTDAVLKADIDEWESLFPLPGVAMLHLEGTYVGQTYIDPSSVSDTLQVSFGKDDAIVVERTKQSDESDKSFFRNRVTRSITHEISIRNTKTSSIKLEIKDQIPVSTRDEIEVSILDLSEGKLEDTTGIVTWNLQIPASETRTIIISYEVRHPSGESVYLD